jgi:hypothetical protein
MVDCLLAHLENAHANYEELREDMHGKLEIASALQERMEAATHSMGSDLQQTIQKKMDTLLGIRPCEVVTETFAGNSKAALEVM